MKWIITYSLLLASFIGLSQNFSAEEIQEIDSLNAIIDNPETHDTVRVLTYSEIILHYYYFNTDTCIIINEKSMAIAEKIDYPYGLAETYGWMGFLYSQKGELDKALEYNQKSMQACLDIEDYESVGTILNNSATIFRSRGQFQEALEMHYQALELYKWLGDWGEVARAYNSIALVQKNQGFSEEALELNHKALELRKKYADKRDIGESLNNIGVIHKHDGQYKLALSYFRQSLKMRLDANYPIGIANSYENIAHVHFITEEYDSSIYYLSFALPMREEMGLIPGLSEVYSDLGASYREIGNLGKAAYYGQMGYDLALEVGYPRLIMNAGLNLAYTYQYQGKYEQAFEAFDTHAIMKDSLNNDEVKQTLAQKEAQYKYEKQKALDDAEYEKQLALEEADKKRKTIINYAIGAVLVLAVFILVFVFNRLQVTRKQKSIIEEQKQEVEEQKSELELTHHALEEKNSEILDSIAYAKRIQTAILPPDTMISDHLRDSFVLYLPKDIVAGDFYWLEPSSEGVLFAAADCTGHGVPGAMVSVVCNNALNRSVREYGLTDPGKILDKTREIVIQEFGKSTEDVKDGMDLAICQLKGRKLKYAGAHNPLWIIRNNELIEIKADKQPVGLFEPSSSFTSHDIDLEEGDVIYIFSDGYADQFGGAKGKKLKSKGLRELLINIHQLSVAEQKEKLHTHFLDWKGDLEQLDDVCVIGLKIS